MADVASTSTSQPLSSAGAKGALWITDNILRPFGSAVSIWTPPLSNRSDEAHVAWLETIMPFTALSRVTGLARTMAAPSTPEPVGPVGPTGPRSEERRVGQGWRCGASQ